MEMTEMDSREMKNIVESAVEAGKAFDIGTPKDLAKEYHTFVVPEGYVVQDFDLARRNEDQEPTPRRHKGTIDVSTVDSFNRFVAREQIPETTVCFSDVDREQFTAVINYAAAGDQPGWGDRKILLSIKKTTEFKRWEENNRKRMSQMQLADFLEENMDSIREPPAAALIEMISHLRVKKRAQFDSVINQENGDQSITYSEEIKGESINGSVDFASKFLVGLTPYRGSDPYAIHCNLRFSVDSNKQLTIFFSMQNIELVKEKAFNAERDKVMKTMEVMGVPVFDV
jgi:uncharacterized protein YfdQ (DUF2303 family)